MNKKGFLKILEAIIAIILIFGFIVTVFPKTQQSAGAPQDLQLTMDAIVKQAQTDNDFRDCVLGGSTIISGVSKTGVDCIDKFVKDNSPPLFPWSHGIKLCGLDDSGSPIIYCEFGISEGCENDGSVLCNCGGIPDNYEQRTKCFNEDKLLSYTANKDVFIKTVTLSVKDVIAPPSNPATPVPAGPKTLTLYFWFKG